jgi:nucleotide-binding universal stress UspA family protein
MARKRRSALTRARERKRKLEEIRVRRRGRFRILACVNGTDESYIGVETAAEIGRSDACDVILLYVRRIDQGLNSGGLQVRVARQNLLEWGLELPGIEFLRHGLNMLLEEEFLGGEWDEHIDHSNVFGDPLGDNKVEYRARSGKSVVLKLKTAPDVASGILDQYELGPYNLIVVGPPKRWRGEVRSFLEPSTVQKVAMLAPCSVLTVRGPCRGRGYLLCTDGSEHSLKSLRRGAVLAHTVGEPVRILGAAPDDDAVRRLETRVERFARGLGDAGITVDDARVERGAPVPTILEASKSASVVVVSDSGKSRLKRFVTGSVAFDVMGRAETSVLNVR